MAMTESDIVKEYNEAKDKDHQITILADLNCTNRKEIIGVLERNGVEVKKKAPTKRGKKPINTPCETTSQVEEKGTADDILMASVIQLLKHRMNAILEDNKGIESVIENLNNKKRSNMTEMAFIKTFIAEQEALLNE